MITTETLFILGAGASAPYGYPTGIQLRDLICGQTRRAAIIKALKPVNEDEAGYAASVDKFISEFSKSSLYSIDFFLENRKEFMDIGKMTIASYLLPYEVDRRLRDPTDNWYMYLYDRLKSSFEDFAKNKISFITFNYDRSLEQFLFEAVRSQFNKAIDECANKLKNIPIIHLYGQLDFLLWQDKVGYEYSRSSVERIRNALKNIKLITEEREVSKRPEFQSAYKLIENSKKIYILGFSFDKVNLDRLNIDLMKDKAIIATSLGLEESKQRWVKKYFKSKINTEVYFFELDALCLLKKDLKIE